VAFNQHALAAATTPDHVISNNYPLGGKHLVIEMVSLTCTVSAAAASAFGLFAMKGTAALVAAQYGTVNTATAVQDLFNGRNMLTYGNVIFGHTGTFASDVWEPLGNFTNSTLTATVGMGMVIRLGGELVIPPQRSLGFCVVEAGAASAGTGTLTYHWQEVQLS
jgi:hypothetical protein